MTEAEFQAYMYAQQVAEQIRGEPKHPVRPKVQCADGWRCSIQASHFHYCSPREDGLEWYETWELGYPTDVPQSLVRYAEDPEAGTETVFAQVPTNVIVDIINSRGGIA